MQFVPYVYQTYAINKILGQDAAGLFIDMGLGKTAVTLTAIDELIYNRFEVNKVLVIAPLRVAQTVWSAEIKKWDHLNHLTISLAAGSGEGQRIRALGTKADIYTINRENLTWLVSHYGKHWPFDMVVIDELSSFKSASAERFKSLRRVRKYIKRIVGLTGTPAPNSLQDLWPQIYLLDQGECLGKTLGGFRDRYFYPVTGYGSGGRTYTRYELKTGAEEKVYEKLEGLCVSMKAEDWLEMPERIDVRVEVELSDDVRQAYLILQRQKVLELAESDISANDAGVLANKLLQMANGAVYDEDRTVHEIHTAKLDSLEELIEAANGQPVLVFYAYKHDRDRIKKRVPIARDLKDAADIDDWNQKKVQVMLAHPASAGHGLNLQDGGHIIIWFGLPWSLELYQQANARLHRQGQRQSVIVHHLVAQGTIDERVMRVLESKASGQEALLEAVKALIKEAGNENSCAGKNL